VVASTIGLMSDVNMAAYSATKAAIHNLTVALSTDLATEGVTVNAISPGLTASGTIQLLLQDMVKKEGWPKDPEQLERGIHCRCGSSVSRRLGSGFTTRLRYEEILGAWLSCARGRGIAREESAAGAGSRPSRATAPC
jgi:NAD(P)-dependent dehydrogenase (short-subunit alcohol dehydrogenase family)